MSRYIGWLNFLKGFIVFVVFTGERHQAKSLIYPFRLEPKIHEMLLYPLLFVLQLIPHLSSGTMFSTYFTTRTAFLRIRFRHVTNRTRGMLKCEYADTDRAQALPEWIRWKNG